MRSTGRHPDLSTFGEHSLTNIYSIYKATNLVNGKIYIGFDSNWPHRKTTHLWSARNQKADDYGSLFHRAIRKYGPDSFEWEVIYRHWDGNYCLNTMESLFIQNLKSHHKNGKGYNITLGGEGRLGCLSTPQQREAQSRRQSWVWCIVRPDGETIYTKEFKKYLKENHIKYTTALGSADRRSPHKGHFFVQLPYKDLSLAPEDSVPPEWWSTNLIRDHSEMIRIERAARLEKGKIKTPPRYGTKYLWEVTDPNQNTITTKNLEVLCIEMNLASSKMSLVASGKRKHHRGWKCRRIQKLQRKRIGDKYVDEWINI